MESNIANLKEAQSRLAVLNRTIHQLQGMPDVLAGQAVKATDDAVEPLRGFNGYTLPEHVKAHGRTLRNLAHEVADDPDRDLVADWQRAVTTLHMALGNYELRKAIRKADDANARARRGPEPPRATKDISGPASRTMERFGLAYTPEPVHTSGPGEGW